MGERKKERRERKEGKKVTFISPSFCMGDVVVSEKDILTLLLLSTKHDVASRST